MFDDFKELFHQLGLLQDTKLVQRLPVGAQAGKFVDFGMVNLFRRERRSNMPRVIRLPATATLLAFAARKRRRRWLDDIAGGRLGRGGRILLQSSILTFQLIDLGLQAGNLGFQLSDLGLKRRDRRFDQLGNFLLSEPSRHAPVVSHVAPRRNTTLGGVGVNGYGCVVGQQGSGFGVPLSKTWPPPESSNPLFFQEKAIWQIPSPQANGR